jgi:glutamyl-tRNA reductase
MTTELETRTKPAASESEPPAVPPTITDELSEVKQATQALVKALQGLARAKIHSAADLTEEAHQSIEQSVQMLREQADHGWQKAVHQVEDIDARMNKAAKAAWEALTAPASETDSKSNP